MGGKVDVLGVLKSHVCSHQALAESDAYSAQEYPKLHSALAAIVELIEADREFDTCEAAYDRCLNYELRITAVEALGRARERRAAALANIGPTE